MYILFGDTEAHNKIDQKVLLAVVSGEEKWEAEGVYGDSFSFLMSMPYKMTWLICLINFDNKT